MNALGELKRWRPGRAWLTNATLCALGAGLVAMAHQFVAEQHRYVIGFSGVSGWSDVLFVAAVIIVLTQPVNRATLWIVLGFAVAMRGMVLFSQPYLSTDIYRYVWDGIVQHAHISPYRYVPGDHALAVLQSKYPEIFQHINRRDYAHTIYPPVAQMIYWLATLFSPTVQAMKLAMFGFECVTAGALIALLKGMGRRTTDVLLYAWCPLLVWEIGGAGHIDAAILAFVALALLFRYREQPVMTGLFLGLAVMTKFYPLILLPALWRRGDWKMPATLVAVCAAGYAVYASVGKLVFGFLGRLRVRGGIGQWDAILPAGLRALDETAWRTCQSGRIMFSAHAWWVGSRVGWRNASVERLGEMRVQRPAFVRGSTMLALALMLLFSPHYSWYIAWLVPLLVVFPNWVTLAYVCAFFYGFTTQWADAWTEDVCFEQLDLLRSRMGLRNPGDVECDGILRVCSCGEGASMRPRVSVVIPALNEAESIGSVVRSMPWTEIAECIVVDNGSTDRTADVARAAGASVVNSPRGYGAACAAGARAALATSDVLVFLDGDGSDDVSAMLQLVRPIESGQADFVIGSRMRGKAEPGALNRAQVLAASMIGTLVNMLYGFRYTDMGPFRAIRRERLEAMQMREMTYGWNLEMQIKAVKMGLRVREIPVDYRCRIGGESKVSGNAWASVKAAARILGVLARVR